MPQTGNDSTSTSGESKRKRKTRLGRFWQDYVSCEVDLSASRDHLGMCTEAHGEGSARVRLEEEFCVARGLECWGRVSCDVLLQDVGHS